MLGLPYLIVFLALVDGIQVDPSGYLMYCPCMGRFGNQAEQFLGSLHFARHLNRTLILPPFIEYDKYRINFIPFDEYIKVEPLQDYHRVILMKDFIGDIAPIIWKESDRSIACYSPRTFNQKGQDRDASCNAFEGSPFKEFWHHFNVTDFPAGSLYYQPLQTVYNFVDQWQQAFGDLPVLTFVGAPSSFPTTPMAIPLQAYVHFSELIKKRAEDYREAQGFAHKIYLSIHLRRGTDWQRACDLIKMNPDLTRLFSSQQCLSEPNEAKLDYGLCMPTMDRIIDDIRQVLDDHLFQFPNHGRIEYIHIATDVNNETIWREIYDRLDGQMTVIGPQSTITKASGEVTLHNQPHFTIDLYLMAHANELLANCISSFSAFPTRYRKHRLDENHLTHYFGMDQLTIERDEL